MNRRDFLMSTAAVGTGMVSKCCARQLNTMQMPRYENTNATLLTDSSATADGFRFPAEWDRHEFTIMALPPRQNWKLSGISYADVLQQWADVANTLADYESVLMVVDPRQKQQALKLLASEIEQVIMPLNDGWSRDSGPMFVVNDDGERRVAGFTFNGWGAKFPPYRDDALLKARLCQHLDVPMYPINLCLEGGAITVDGEGTVLTTEQCLLHPNRNATGDRSQVEKILNDSLGTTKVVWLGQGLTPDPVTDGHVDGIAAFIEPGTVLLHTTDDRRDPNFRICQDAKQRLHQATDARGRKLEVIELPLDGDLSHMNFYIANECILVPVTTDPRQDNRPLGVLRELFASREVVGVDSRVLAEGGGGIHCITQQVPGV